MRFRSVWTFVSLYVALVKPILMYASQIWSPSVQGLSKKLESVQHLFLRMASWKTDFALSQFDHDYSHISKYLGICSLQSNRKFSHLMFLFKLLNGFIDCPDLVKLVNFHVPGRVLRRSGLLFSSSHDYDNYRNLSPIVRLSFLGNSCHESCDLFGVPISQFKIQARNELFEFL